MKKISKNFISILLSDGVGHIFGFLATVYIVRLLDAAGFGKISYALAFLSYGLLVGNLGLTTIGARETAKAPYNITVIEEIITLRLALAILIFLILTLGVITIPGDFLTKKIIFLYGFSLFPYAVFLEFVFQGREEMEYIGIARFVQYGSYLLLLLLLLKNPSRILTVPISFFISYILAAGFLAVIFLKKYRSFKFIFSLKSLYKLFTLAIPVGLATLFYQLTLNLGPIILGIFHTDLDVAYFSAGYKIIFLILIIERVFYYLFFSRASWMSVQYSTRLADLFTIFTRLLFVITIPATAAGILLGPAIIKTIYGTGFENAVAVLRILFLYFLITPINTIWGYGLVALGKEKKFLKIIGIIALVSLILVVVLGIFYKSPGVGVALLIGEVVGVIFMRNELSKVVRFKLSRSLIKPLAASLAMLVILFFCQMLNLILLMLIGLLGYAIALYLLGGFRKKELDELRSLLSQN